MLQIIIILAASLLVGVDQLTKWLAVEQLQEGKPLPVIDGVFESRRCFRPFRGTAVAFYGSHHYCSDHNDRHPHVWPLSSVQAGQYQRYPHYCRGNRQYD